MESVRGRYYTCSVYMYILCTYNVLRAYVCNAYCCVLCCVIWWWLVHKPLIMNISCSQGMWLILSMETYCRLTLYQFSKYNTMYRHVYNVLTICACVCVWVCMKKDESIFWQWNHQRCWSVAGSAVNLSTTAIPFLLANKANQMMATM